MNFTAFKEAQAAYSAGDYDRALEGFTTCTYDLSELTRSDLGKLYHLIGNCHIKGGDPLQAAAFYRRAIGSSPEERQASLYVNLGTALLGSSDYEDALDAFRAALSYGGYATPYKAYAGIGAAQLKLGNLVEAGAAYREAAIDRSNPAPEKALVNLGVCFMELERPADAAVSYETALEFDLDPVALSKTKANLGQAYMAQGRIQDAIEAFEEAESGSGYELSPMARHDLEIARSLRNLETSSEESTHDEDIEVTSDAVGDLNEAEEELEAPADEVEPEEAPEVPAAEFDLETAVREEMRDIVKDDVIFEQEAAEDLPTQRMPVVTDQELDSSEDEADTALEPEQEMLSSAETIRFPAVGAAPLSGDVLEDGEETLWPASEQDMAVSEGDEEWIEDDESEASHDSEREGLSAEDFAEMEDDEVILPSPEDTAFFDLSEQQIDEDARLGRRKARKARGVGLKVAISIIVVCILLAVAVCAAYVLGYGYPLQESIAENFFSAAQQGQSTDAYWADDVDASTRTAQLASLEGITSYQVSAVQRSMSQSIVYMQATLKEGGQIYYELVLGRKGVGWVVEYVELYFPSEQN